MISVTSTVDEAVGTLTFANPAQRGALTPEMLVALRAQIVSLERDYPRVRVVVIRGAGDVFSSGYAIDRIPAPHELPVKDEIEELCEAIENSPLVMIALLRGPVVGAALDIASACDFRFAERTCRLGITPARLGLVYTVFGTARIRRLVGPDWARMLFYTGDLLPADLAATIGLVTKVHDDPGELDRETYQIAHRIASRAPLAVSGSKQIFRALESAGDLPPEQVRRLHALRCHALGSEDAREARLAFTQKRAPRFTGTGGQP
ncbi:MAG: enoyl-CoA hydratase/isomerase family protein [Actinophytocola sp.]|uniref:enoyl-CoA hydratase/isomerase family protein n=1 Tax=Actinophytocola sp. TaxID=1872138 RepID=UPI001329A288|nr:enoyl-CoA hydratase-related protein [Actinophytocola sp.]MPZ83532.1 enoyl-CoA hydratase/isomerase family protein [Actinophytocola sp.]